jgi:Polyketide cyclase / dehydrase and lipid transport
MKAPEDTKQSRPWLRRRRLGDGNLQERGCDSIPPHECSPAHAARCKSCVGALTMSAFVLFLHVKMSPFAAAFTKPLPHQRSESRISLQQRQFLPVIVPSTSSPLAISFFGNPDVINNWNQRRATSAKQASSRNSSNSKQPWQSLTTATPRPIPATDASRGMARLITPEKRALRPALDDNEFVSVKIERPSTNSRRIYGEITVPVPLQDVWSILTDYDRLAIHVPNLVESRVVQPGMTGQPGDGSYKCRLYQKGAQKIIGFEFGASVTMDMQEYLIPSVAPSTSGSFGGSADLGGPTFQPSPFSQGRITFKCVDSFFFNEFDGEWKVTEAIADFNSGSAETILSYVVDVRPKGPVPVAALEWQIQSEVPNNLRAVKKAAVLFAYNNLDKALQFQERAGLAEAVETPSPYGDQRLRTLTPTFPSTSQQQFTKPAAVAAKQQFVSTLSPRQTQRPGPSSLRRLALDVRNSVQWDLDETMGAYLK